MQKYRRQIQDPGKAVAADVPRASGATGGDGPRRHYAKPALTRHGDVRGLTLGPTLGLGESHNILIYKGASLTGSPAQARPTRTNTRKQRQ